MPDILVVDDSDGDRAIVLRLLSKDSKLRIEAAGDGAEALEKIAARPPDVIVTDLRMPRIDGLQLVDRVSSDYPEIPVILMTANGSEEVALEALELGAAGYVPKVQLPEKLLSTVAEVLALSRASRSHQRLIDCLQSTKFEFQLDNDPQLIPALVDLVQQMLAGVQLCDANGRVRVAVALEEALLNALYHGNLELGRQDLKKDAAADSLAAERRSQPPYRDRRIHFAADISTTFARFTVRDEGPGFDLKEIPNPRQAENVERCAGRGLLLMQTFMDEVRFNDAGNEVTMEVDVLKTR
jgi:CheY-like chemotaxis protein/anti-sigma regulatory factor (Ser/Thr protein kinase)